jgi:hypothetical protein
LSTFSPTATRRQTGAFLEQLAQYMEPLLDFISPSGITMPDQSAKPELYPRLVSVA